MSDSTTEHDRSGINNPSTEDFIYVDDETGDSEFEPNEGSAAQDDDSIAPDEDIPDDGEVDSLMRESEMSLSDLLASYGVPPSEIPARSEAGAAAAAASSSTTSALTGERRFIRKRRHNGSAVVAEPPPVPISETTAARDNSIGIGTSSGKAIEIDLTTESNDDEYPAQNRHEGGANAVAYDELGQSGSEEPMETEEDDEDDAVDEEGMIVGDEEGDEEDKHREDVTRWCKALATGESPAYNSEEDEDYQPNVEGTGDWRGDIRVGDDFQAVIPLAPLAPSRRTDSHLGSEARLIWQPGHISEAVTERYERTYTQTISELPASVSTPDDEEALFHLMRSGYDADEALCRLQNRPVQPFEIRRPVEEWTDEDCTNFEKGFASYEKNFFKIRAHRLPHKTTKDLVLFYYFYKKTARYEELIRLSKGEKNKPSHPAITDFMDVLMHQQHLAASAVQGASSNSPNLAQEVGESRTQPQPTPSPSGDAASSGSSHSVIAISSNDSGDETHSQQGASSVSPSSSSVAAAAPSSTVL
ncbi:unnamed protein product [Rodentolepis nana]|uniref:Mesoderm induction early response protein 1 n=1 Tax=Rodentolepis nana TaxID=102285 RepID=A0A0R3TMW4_RODNA|nr:unnamed protein product [Rodentolepis nana]